MKKIVAYMDLCCFNRPFDDQSSRYTYLETEAKLFIQDLVRMRKIDIVWSYVLDFENSANPDVEVRDAISKWKKISICTIAESDEIVDRAERFHRIGLGIKDSLHISCAVEAKAKHFITTDKGIVRKKKLIQEINLLNPIEFIEYEDHEK